MNGVPFLDLARLHESIRNELDEVFDEVLRTSAFVGSRPVQAFEEAFAAAHHANAAAGCGSGTDALALGLRALGIGEGDEVVVPSMTFVATAEAVVHAGATPVIADVDPTSLLLAPDGVDAVRTGRTRAVMPVHLYGHVVPLEHLKGWRDEGLVVVEDAAQAHLATWNGSSVGSAGHVACFSFYPGKNLGAMGDGGAVISADAAVVSMVRRLRDHGRSTKYEHNLIGWCSRLDGLQARILAVKLRHLPEWTESRRRLADRYRSRLGEVLVPWEPGAVHHLVVARVAADRRADIQRVLREEGGIETGIHYPLALSDQPAMAPWAKPCPVAERAAAEVLSLPMDPLMTDDQVDEVCTAVLRIV